MIRRPGRSGVVGDGLRVVAWITRAGPDDTLVGVGHVMRPSGTRSANGSAANARRAAAVLHPAMRPIVLIGSVARASVPESSSRRRLGSLTRFRSWTSAPAALRRRAARERRLASQPRPAALSGPQLSGSSSPRRRRRASPRPRRRPGPSRISARAALVEVSSRSHSRAPSRRRRSLDLRQPRLCAERPTSNKARSASWWPSTNRAKVDVIGLRLRGDDAESHIFLARALDRR